MQGQTFTAAEQAACSSDRVGAHLCVLEIVTPQRADLVLTSHIPHREADVLVLDSLHVEACAKTFRTEFQLRPRSERCALDETSAYIQKKQLYALQRQCNFQEVCRLSV